MKRCFWSFLVSPLFSIFMNLGRVAKFTVTCWAWIWLLPIGGEKCGKTRAKTRPKTRPKTRQKTRPWKITEADELEKLNQWTSEVICSKKIYSLVTHDTTAKLPTHIQGLGPRHTQSSCQRRTLTSKLQNYSKIDGGPLEKARIHFRLKFSFFHATCNNFLHPVVQKHKLYHDGSGTTGRITARWDKNDMSKTVRMWTKNSVSKNCD